MPSNKFQLSSLMKILITLLIIIYPLLCLAVSDPDANKPLILELGQNSEVLNILLLKINEEQLDQVLDQFSDIDITQTQLSSLLSELGVAQAIIDSTLNEVNAYCALVQHIQSSEAVILLLIQTEAEIKELRTNLEQTQSIQEQKSLDERITSHNETLAKQKSRLASVLELVRYENKEKLESVFELLEYSENQIAQFFPYIRDYLALTKTIETLTTIKKSITAINKEIKVSRRAYKKAGTPQEKTDLNQQLRALSQRKDSFEANFSNLSSGLDKEELFNKKEVKTNFQNDLVDMFSPIINELKGMTEKPRRIEALHHDLADYQFKLAQIHLAINNIEQLNRHNTTQSLDENISNIADFWQQKQQEYTSLNEATQRKIDMELASEVSIGERMGQSLKSFFHERGRHLFLAILAFILIYMLFQFFQRLFHKHNPLRHNEKYMVWANLADLLFSVMTFVAAIGAMLIVLYLSGDWLILSIIALIFVGLAWAARNGLPQYMEQMKLLLNFGSVRQDELIMHDGIPWKVESIGVYSYFVNPLLTGGRMRLPIQDLISMRSRPCDKREPWFPCKEGDYILINGKQWRQIALLTPLEVQFHWYDMIERMPMQQFIGQRLFNISNTPFWAGGSFNIAYQHRHGALEEITKQLCDFVEAYAKEKPYAEHLLYTWVEFGQCTDNSLEFMVWLQLSSEAADKYDRVLLDINQVTLDAANHYQWEVLRFQPIDVHMAKPNNFIPTAIETGAIE
ncbi:MAG: hypothetical protein Q9M28_03740 [Mariprofundaceae bacterium]|nr:hypothetical protein [Mariprofundaceae bacterium]